MRHYLLIVVCWFIATLNLSAAVISYQPGDLIQVKCQPSSTPNRESLRQIQFLSESKLKVIGSWLPGTLELQQNGNTVTFSLQTSTADIPVYVLGAGGQSYYVVVSAARGGQVSPPVVQVVAAPTPAAGSPAADDDVGLRNGGSWENDTNLVLKLHKHIRGGRPLVTVRGRPRFNEEILNTEKRRVQGRVWTKSDDYQTLEYFEWTLDRVSAHLLGVTYNGRESSVDFDYLEQQTDETIAIFSFPNAEDPPIFTVSPVLRLHPGQERLFILYTAASPDFDGVQP